MINFSLKPRKKKNDKDFLACSFELTDLHASLRVFEALDGAPLGPEGCVELSFADPAQLKQAKAVNILSKLGMNDNTLEFGVFQTAFGLQYPGEEISLEEVRWLIKDIFGTNPRKAYHFYKLTLNLHDINLLILLSLFSSG